MRCAHRDRSKHSKPRHDRTTLAFVLPLLLISITGCAQGADENTPGAGAGGYGDATSGVGGTASGSGGKGTATGGTGVGGSSPGVTGGTGGGGPGTGGNGAGGIGQGGSGAGGAGTGGSGASGSGGGAGSGGGTEADYRDPKTGAWQRVAPDQCGLDATKFADAAVANYAVFRHGKLCHMKGSDTAGSMYSATKTLGGVMIGRAAYLTRSVPRTGPGTGMIILEDKAIDWLGSVSYNRNATLSHVMSMCAHNTNLAYGAKSFSYDTVGSVQINTMIAVTEKSIAQVPGLGSDAVSFVEREVFAKLGMTSSRWSRSLGISTGWTANLSDMGKLGTLLLHDGFYGGERLLSREWVYRMSHPAFEDSNTSYGQLAWLNHRGNAAGIGGNITSGANAPQGDPCAPPAFWPTYPHGISEAPDCRATVGSCAQQHDVGVYSAQGLNGQFIVMHPGLDMVIAARNFSGGDGPLGLWRAVRPALVAMDPAFRGDEASFCAAYGAGNYAPDLPMRRSP